MRVGIATAGDLQDIIESGIRFHDQNRLDIEYRAERANLSYAAYVARSIVYAITELSATVAHQENTAHG